MLQLITPGVAASGDAAFLAEVRDYLRIDDSTEDALIGATVDGIFASLDGLRGHTNRAWITGTYQLTQPGFTDPIILPRPPVTTVTSVEYRDTDGNWQAFNEFEAVHLGSLYQKAELVLTGSTPTLYPYGDAVRVTYTAGQAALPSGLPEDFKLVVKTMVNDAYEQRNSVNIGNINELPSFQGLVARIRLLEV